MIVAIPGPKLCQNKIFNTIVVGTKNILKKVNTSKLGQARNSCAVLR